MPTGSSSGEVISSAALAYVSVEVNAKFGDSRSNSGLIYSTVWPTGAVFAHFFAVFTADQKQLVTSYTEGQWGR